ncbi:hypothetical protein OAV41_03385 [Planctomycetota bacterium]|nr:hypothetical protein [Planctomycetota bacterium]
MNKTLSTVLILITGFIGGLLGPILLGDTGSQYDMSIDAAAASDTQELRNEIAGLTSANDSLRSSFDLQATRLGQLEDKINSLPLPPAGGPEGLAFADMPTGQAFEGQINAVIEQRENQQSMERDQARAERRAEANARRVERMAEELGLSPQQTDQFATIVDDAATERSEYFSEIRENGWENIDRDEMRSTMETMREDEYSALEGVLTPEQLTQYQESNSNSGWGGGGRGGNNGGGRGGSTGGGRGNDF